MKKDLHALCIHTHVCKYIKNSYNSIQMTYPDTEIPKNVTRLSTEEGACWTHDLRRQSGSQATGIKTRRRECSAATGVAEINISARISARTKGWPGGRAVGLAVALAPLVRLRVCAPLLRTEQSSHMQRLHKHRLPATAWKSHAPWTVGRLVSGGLFTEKNSGQQNNLVLYVS